VSDEPRLRVVRPGEDQHYPRASLLLRVGARLVDCVIAWVLFQTTGPAGIVIALLYLLFADGMLAGQSPGKKLFGVKAVYLPTRTGARHRDSVLRNAPFGLVVILGMMPDLGFKAFIAGAIVTAAIEGARAFRDEHGLRLGDLWAQTQVIDGKVPLAPPQVVREQQEARAGGRLMRTQDTRPIPRSDG
jgi:uncharacterized RDD family membrane protein YckC